MAEKILEKLRWVYLPKIIWTSLLGRPQRKSLEHNNYLYVAFMSEQRVRQPPTENVPSLHNYFQTNCWSVLLMLFKKKKHWDILLEGNFADLGHVFAHWFNWGYFVTRSTTFLSSTVFVISRLVFFLVRRQSSEGLLWRSHFWWTPRKTMKEPIFTIVESLKPWWKCTVVQMFF